MTGRVLPGAQIGARWQVNQLIGSGALAEVYEVVEIASGRVYALKLFAPELTRAGTLWQDYQTLARRASSLAFDAIAKVHEFGADQSLGSGFSVGERVLWPPLDQLVRQRGPLAAERVAALLELLAPALDAAHAAGIVHRGISPSNVFCAKEGGGARLSDFGASLLRRAVNSPPGWAGPPGFIGPDAVEHAAPSHPRMDVFSLGAVVFFALTGQSPFKAMQAKPIDFGVLWNELILPLPPASQRAKELGASLPPELDPWFAQTLSPHPKARFATIGEAARAFGQRASTRIRQIAGPVAAAPVAAAPPGTIKKAPMKTMMGGFGVGVPAPPAEGGAGTAAGSTAKRTMPMIAIGDASTQRGLPKLPERPVVTPPELSSKPTNPGLGGVAASVVQPKLGLGGTVVIEDAPSLLAAATAAPNAGNPGAPPTAPFLPAGQVPEAHGPAAAPVSPYAPTDPAAPALQTASSYRPPAPSVSDSGPVALVSARPLAYMADLPRPAPARPAAQSAPDAVPAVASGTSRKPGLLLPLLLGGGLTLLAVIALGAWLVVRAGKKDDGAPAKAPAGTETSSAAPELAPAPTPETASAPSALQSAPAAVASTVVPPVESAAPTTATDAMVKFQCQPGCETIQCDGTAIESIAGVRLTAGTHRCRARKPGYYDRTDEIVVKAGVDQTHVFRLRPEPEAPKPAEARPERPRPSEPRPSSKPSTSGKGEKTEKKKKPCGTFINPCK
jgi:eukaryotic-like serine/threonine-protein kinase